MDYKKAEEYIFNRLRKELPSNLYYHDFNHTYDVLNAADWIAKAENVSEEEFLIVKTAALYHDVGFVVRYLNNEPIGAHIAQQTLPAFGYNQTQIDQISEIIMATGIPRNPQNKLEKIMCDADLDYLGRDDYSQLSSHLQKELMEYGLIMSLKEWYEFQINFLVKHIYYTDTVLKLREQKKQVHLNLLQESLKNFYAFNAK
jgi:predicted metal-dependent HD superfamily phosphohydrolase